METLMRQFTHFHDQLVEEERKARLDMLNPRDEKQSTHAAAVSAREQITRMRQTLIFEPELPLMPDEDNPASVMLEVLSGTEELPQPALLPGGFEKNIYNVDEEIESESRSDRRWKAENRRKESQSFASSGKDIKEEEVDEQGTTGERREKQEISTAPSSAIEAYLAANPSSWSPTASRLGRGLLGVASPGFHSMTAQNPGSMLYHTVDSVLAGMKNGKSRQKAAKPEGFDEDASSKMAAPVAVVVADYPPLLGDRSAEVDEQYARINAFLYEEHLRLTLLENEKISQATTAATTIDSSRGQEAEVLPTTVRKNLEDLLNGGKPHGSFSGQILATRELELLIAQHASQDHESGQQVQRVHEQNDSVEYLMLTQLVKDLQSRETQLEQLFRGQMEEVGGTTTAEAEAPPSQTIKIKQELLLWLRGADDVHNTGDTRREQGQGGVLQMVRHQWRRLRGTGASSVRRGAGFVQSLRNILQEVAKTFLVISELTDVFIPDALCSEAEEEDSREVVAAFALQLDQHVHAHDALQRQGQHVGPSPALLWKPQFDYNNCQAPPQAAARTNGNEGEVVERTTSSSISSSLSSSSFIEKSSAWAYTSVTRSDGVIAHKKLIFDFTFGELKRFEEPELVPKAAELVLTQIKALRQKIKERAKPLKEDLKRKGFSLDDMTDLMYAVLEVFLQALEAQYTSEKTEGTTTEKLLDRIASAFWNRYGKKATAKGAEIAVTGVINLPLQIFNRIFSPLLEVVEAGENKEATPSTPPQEQEQAVSRAVGMAAIVRETLLHHFLSAKQRFAILEQEAIAKVAGIALPLAALPSQVVAKAQRDAKLAVGHVLLESWAREAGRHVGGGLKSIAESNFVAWNVEFWGMVGGLMEQYLPQFLPAYLLHGSQLMHVTHPVQIGNLIFEKWKQLATAQGKNDASYRFPGVRVPSEDRNYPGHHLLTWAQFIATIREMAPRAGSNGGAQQKMILGMLSGELRPITEVRPSRSLIPSSANINKYAGKLIAGVSSRFSRSTRSGNPPSPKAGGEQQSTLGEQQPSPREQPPPELLASPITSGTWFMQLFKEQLEIVSAQIRKDKENRDPATPPAAAQDVDVQDVASNTDVSRAAFIYDALSRWWTHNVFDQEEEVKKPIAEVDQTETTTPVTNFYKSSSMLVRIPATKKYSASAAGSRGAQSSENKNGERWGLLTESATPHRAREGITAYELIDAHDAADLFAKVILLLFVDATEENLKTFNLERLEVEGDTA
ncbi:unnamed protein product [Amoebophrya sp. A120]|nr:unnamed protein product [Amoebophrya sp. A120]|eukprot:GSA120T00004352001.1